MPRPKRTPVQRLSATSVPWPLDWAALFPHHAPDSPRILEIGFGYGHFLRWLSQSQPTARIIGIEIDSTSLQKAEGACDRGELPNVRVMFARAETALAHVFEPESLDEIHVNFPDPWFKSGHAQRRLIQRATLDYMASRLKTGGLFTLATDIREYADMSAEHLAETPTLTNTFAPEPWSWQRTIGVMTKYEARGYQEGRAGHYFVYRRNSTPALDLPVIRELPMPHMKLAQPLTPAEVVARFAPFRAHAVGDLHISIMAAFSKPDAVLFECYVVEPSLHQSIAIIMARNPENGEDVISLGNLGTPRPTDAAHFAVRKVTEWIASLSPEARITGDYARHYFTETSPTEENNPPVH